MANVMLGMGKEFGKDVAKLMLYTAYPVLGNLSGNLKKRIERNCSWFNEEAASMLTNFINVPIYGAIAGYSFNQIDESENALISATIIFGGAAFGALEGIVRMYKDKKLRIKKPRAIMLL